MKTSIKSLIAAALTVCLALGCKKEDVSTSTITLACRVDAQVVTTPNTGDRITYYYDKDSQIEASVYAQKDNGGSYSIGRTTTNYTYSSGLLTGATISGQTHEEKYDYTNGMLSKITMVKTTNSSDAGYMIMVETDANKRIVKLTDSRGVQSVFKRDAKGNLVQQDRIKDGALLSRIVWSDSDEKKTIEELYKGWQFDIINDYRIYMTEKVFTTGASGNPRKEIFYNAQNVAITEITHGYTYSAEGYPISQTSVVKAISTGKESVTKNDYSLADCK